MARGFGPVRRLEVTTGLHVKFPTVLTWRLPSPDALMETFRQATARMGGLLAAQDLAVLPAIAAAMTEGCKPHVRDGVADLPMPAVLTVGTKA